MSMPLLFLAFLNLHCSVPGLFQCYSLKCSLCTHTGKCDILVHREKASGKKVKVKKISAEK